MPNAEIITIGTEILLGEIVDTNAAYLARTLRQAGINLYRKTSVGDNAQRISQVIQQALQRSEIVITTGGLGPTVDDPTRDAVALAVGRQTEFLPELWEQIQARFRRFERIPTENNKRQAYVPQGALVLENQVGTAPCFLVEAGQAVIISLPGVPREMEYVMQNGVLPYLHRRYPDLDVLLIKVIHTTGAGESQIDEIIGDLETLSNPTVGLAAHSGQVDVRIVAKAETQAQAEALIQPVEDVLHQRLGKWIYGEDAQTLEETALHSLREHGWRLATVEAGIGAALITRLTQVDSVDVLIKGEVLPQALSVQALAQAARSCRAQSGAEVTLGVTIISAAERQEIRILLITPHSEEEFIRPYGGPPKNAPAWAVNQSLNLLRNVSVNK